MRIAIDGFSLQRGGGVRRYLEQLLSAMARVDPSAEFHLVVDRGHSASVPEGVREVSELPRSFGLRWLREQGFLRSAYARIRPDVVHHPKGCGLAAPAGAPLVVTVHDLLPVTHPRTESRPARIYWRTNLPWVSRSASRVIVDSRYSRDAFLRGARFPEDRVRVVYPGCGERFRPPAQAELDRVRAAYRLEKPYLLTVGTLQPRKNPLAAVGAFQALRAGGFDGELLLAGRAGWGIPDRSLQGGGIRRLGFVPDEDLPGLYGGAAAFLYPSLGEGFGFPPLEAMACGAPVIASRSGSLAEILGEGALWVDPSSTVELARAARDLLASPSLRERLRKAGPGVAARFRWEEAARGTLAVYREASENG